MIKKETLGTNGNAGFLSTDACKALLSAAYEMYTDEGTLEVDQPADEKDIREAVHGFDTPKELMENGGCYVKAYVWMSLPDLDKKICKKVLGKHYRTFVDSQT